MPSRRPLPVRRLPRGGLLRAADLRSAHAARPEGRLRQASVALALCAALGACGGGSGKIEVPPVDDTDGNTSCGLDAMLGFDTASVLTPGVAAADTICPRKDQDFWSLDLAAGQLVSFDAKYEKLANMQLAVDWYGPVGACVPTTVTACSGASDCPGQTCDTARGGCRRTAPGELCASDADCQAGEHCVGATVKLGSPIVSLREAGGSASIHRVTGTVGSLMAGLHYFVIYDASNTLADASTKYSLAANVVPDPDGHEVNDAKNLATPLTSGTAVDAYLSRTGVSGTPGDIDWYVITPTGGSQQVVTVELTSPKASGASPSWTLYQGTQSFPFETSKTQEVGTASGNVVVRSSALVMPSTTDPIYLQVSDTSGGSDAAVPYHLTVTLAADDSEPTRNDTPDTATPFAAGTPSSGSSQTFTGTLVAENDQDWYRIDKAASPTDHSLLYFKLQAPPPCDTGVSPCSHFLLQATTFSATTQSCTQDSDCTSGPQGAPSGRCLATKKCVVGLLQRPAPDVVGDPQLGGLTPNYIESQQPIFASGTGAVYLLVSHNASTTRMLPGYSGTDSYSLQLVHKAEPDSEDATNPDNKFVSRPLMPNLSEGDFRAHGRVVSTSSSGGGGGQAFVAVGVPTGQSGTYATVGGCVTVPLLAFDASGAAATSTTSVTLTAASGTLTTTCGGAAAPSPFTITGASGTIGYTPTGAAPVPGALLTTSVGGAANSAPQAFATVAAGSSGLSFVATSGSTLPRRLGMHARSPTPIRLQLPAAVTAAKVFTLDTGGKADVVCHTASGSACPGATGLSTPCGTTSTGTGLACQIGITSGSTYDLDLYALSAGVITLTATDAGNVLAPTSFVATAAALQSLTSVTASGFISYEGDNDFFTINVGSFPAGGLTLTVDMPASPVDIRIQAARGDRGSSAWAVDCDQPDNSALCAVDDCVSRSCAGPGTCDPNRKTCDQPVLHKSVGPAGSPAQCIYVTAASSTVEVFVNDLQSNDWDEVHPYTFTVQLTEGCPTQCAGVGYACTP